MSDYDAGKKSPIYNLQDHITVSPDKKKVTFFLPGNQESNKDSKEITISILGRVQGWIETKLGWATFVPTDPKDPKKGFYSRNIELSRVFPETISYNATESKNKGWFQKMFGRTSEVKPGETRYILNKVVSKDIGQIFAKSVLLEPVRNEPTLLKYDSSLKGLTTDEDFMLKLIKENPKAIIQTDKSLLNQSEFISKVKTEAPEAMKYLPQDYFFEEKL